MANITPLSPSSNKEPFDPLELRQRESSVGNFDSRNEPPNIAQLNADLLRDKLSQGRNLTLKWKHPDELYYMSKITDHWPWERADILTPTPPEERTDMLTPTPPELRSNLEISNSKTFGYICGRDQDELLPNLLHRIKPPLNPPKRHNLRSNHSSPKRTRSGIQKKRDLQRKHSMVTRSVCRGGCQRRQSDC